MKPKSLSLPDRGEVASGPSPVDANSVQNKTKALGGPAAGKEMSDFRAKQRGIPDICCSQSSLAGSSVHPGRTSLLSYFSLLSKTISLFILCLICALFECCVLSSSFRLCQPCLAVNWGFRAQSQYKFCCFQSPERFSQISLIFFLKKKKSWPLEISWAIYGWSHPVIFHGPNNYISLLYIKPRNWARWPLRAQTRSGFQNTFYNRFLGFSLEKDTFHSSAVGLLTQQWLAPLSWKQIIPRT